MQLVAQLETCVKCFSVAQTVFTKDKVMELEVWLEEANKQYYITEKAQKSFVSDFLVTGFKSPLVS